MPAATGEIPSAGEAIAAGDSRRARGVGRPPGDERTRIAEDSARNIGFQKRCDQRRAVGDEGIPGDRGIVTGKRLDHLKACAGLGLPTADGTRKKQSQQLRVVQLRQQRLRNAARFFDRVGGSGNCRAEIVRDRDRVLAAVAVHARPHG